MIIDAHVHVFPPEVKADRSSWLARDATFRELYQDPKARIATAEDLLRSMDTAGVDMALMQGFAWTDPEDCRRHNDALLDAAARHPDRLFACCTLNPAAGPESAAEASRCLALGARGFGELRPDAQGYAGAPGALAGVRAAARASGALLLVHASEPVGHRYPGKGRMTPELLLSLAEAYPDWTMVFAHLGGGLPLYAAMPEVRQALANVWFDTAAWPLLYGPEVFAAVDSAFGLDRVLFASDYPLQRQDRAVERIRALDLPAETIAGLLGGHAARLLGLGA